MKLNSSCCSSPLIYVQKRLTRKKEEMERAERGAEALFFLDFVFC